MAVPQFTRLSPTSLVFEYTDQRRRPNTRVEGALTRSEYLFRILVGGVPRLLVSIDDWWESYVFVRPDARSWEPFMGPLQSADLQSGRDWLWHFATRIVESEFAPLHEGRFRVELSSCGPAGTIQSFLSNSPAPPHLGGYEATQDNFWKEDGNGVSYVKPGAVLPLRSLGPEDAGRLKWWRKLARRERIPPVITWYVPVLERHLVLDGHVRLRAALTEQAEVPIACLCHDTRWFMPEDGRAAMVRGVAELLVNQPTAIEKANKLLREAYEGIPSARQRGWPIPGGANAWLEAAELVFSRSDDLPGWVSEWLTRLRPAEPRR